MINFTEYWRSGRRPSKLWKQMVLSSCVYFSQAMNYEAKLRIFLLRWVYLPPFSLQATWRYIPEPREINPKSRRCGEPKAVVSAQESSEISEWMLCCRAKDYPAQYGVREPELKKYVITKTTYNLKNEETLIKKIIWCKRQGQFKATR